MTDRQTEALKLAQEALEYFYLYAEGRNEEKMADKTITAIRKALAEQPAPQQQCMEHGECFGGECIYPAPQPAQQQSCYCPNCEALSKELAAIKAQQEPVVWMYVNKSTHETKFQKHMRDFVDHSLWSEVPLYGEPLANHELQCVCGAVWLGDEMVHLPDKRPPAQQEPVAWKDRTYGNLHHQDFGNSIPLYASPPASKPWVGLTDEEVIILSRYDLEYAALIGEVQRKLKEKNT